MRKKHQRLSIRKRSFLLLEVVVCLTLVLLVLVPLIKPISGIRKASHRVILDHELERASKDAFCAIKESLYENRGPGWEELKNGVQGTLSTLKVQGRDFVCAYTLTKTSGKSTTLLLDCTLTFIDVKSGKKTPFSYPLLVERREKA